MGIFDHLKGHHPVGEDEARAAAGTSGTKEPSEPAVEKTASDTDKSSAKK